MKVFTTDAFMSSLEREDMGTLPGGPISVPAGVKVFRFGTREEAIAAWGEASGFSEGPAEGGSDPRSILMF